MREGELQKEYAGNWVNDRKDGYGTQYYKNGDVYDGEWFDGKKSGWGRMKYADGSVYEVCIYPRPTLDPLSLPCWAGQLTSDSVYRAAGSTGSATGKGCSCLRMRIDTKANGTRTTSTATASSFTSIKGSFT